MVKIKVNNNAKNGEYGVDVNDTPIFGPVAMQNGFLDIRKLRNGKWITKCFHLR